jgi:hypothetical protein
VLQLCCDQTQHVLATTEKSNSSGIIDIGLCFVEALLHNI